MVLLKANRILKIMGPETSPEEIACVLDMPIETVLCWVEDPNSTISPPDADKCATRIGLHPFAIWGWDWIEAA
jgi:hypothetical protein